jgi:hypothetical protein
LLLLLLLSSEIVQLLLLLLSSEIVQLLLLLLLSSINFVLQDKKVRVLTRRTSRRLCFCCC